MPDPNSQTLRHQPWLAGYAFLSFAVALCLLYAGGFTTTIGAGMVFPDWPLSNGSLNPPGWAVDEAMRAEHGHRLLGMTLGSLTIGLALWLQRREPRRWLRRLGWMALGLVIFQGLLGGLRVLLVSIDLAKLHGITAQIFLCVLASIAAGLSRWWLRQPTQLTPDAAPQWRRHFRMGFWVCAAILVQLTLGAILRHRGAGLALPYFPASTAEGGLLPASWNWAVALAFAHRAFALVVTALFARWAWRVWSLPESTPAMRRLVLAGSVLLALQILLGASVICTGRLAIPTTLHVLNGAIFFACAWTLTFAHARPYLGEARHMDWVDERLRPMAHAGQQR